MKNRSDRFAAYLLASTCIAIIQPTAAFAQVKNDSPEERSANASFGDIIVTAQRREERLQDVPIAVSAVTADTLAAKGIKDTIELAQVIPGLSFTTTSGSTQVRMRGIGTQSFGPGIENPVAIYLDGVYMASAAGVLFNLANIERVEALKGPQGTLFGRNATGGLVQIVTPEPSHQSSGFIRAGYGSYRTSTVDLYVTGGATETLAADFSFHYLGQGKGFGKSITTGLDVNRQDVDLIARSKIKFQPSDAVKFILAGDYSYSKGSRTMTQQQRAGVENIGLYEKLLTNRNDSITSNDLPIIEKGGFYDTAEEFQPIGTFQIYGASLTSSIDLGGAELKSITAYRRTIFGDHFGLDRLPQNVVRFDGTAKWKQFSQELQINGGSGRLTYTAGAYYFWSKDDWDQFLLQFGPALADTTVAPGAIGGDLIYNSTLRTNSLAGYAQATYEFLPDTHLTLGGRYTHETKEVSGTRSFTRHFPTGDVALVPVGTPYLPAGVNPKLSYNNFSYRISLDHKFTPDIMLYVSYNTGFKSGFYNLSSPTNPSVLPEKLKAIEGGLKMALFNRNLRLNISAYHYDYTNIQVNNFTGTSQFITNGPAAKVDGVEVEFDARIAKGFTLSGSAAYADHRFTKYPLADFTWIPPQGCDTSFASNSLACKGNAKGNRLPGSPVFTASLGGNYEASIGNNVLGLSANLFHSGGFYATPDNDPRARQEEYNLVNGSIYFEPGDNGLRFTLWAKNLFDKKYVTNYLVTNKAVVFPIGDPRTWGVTVEKKF